jgi:putative hydrolase of the HAD superfamily
MVDTRRAFYAAIAAVSEGWLRHLPASRYDEVARRWVADVGGHFRTYTRGEISVEEQRRRRVADLHRTFGGPDLDDEQFTAWYAAYDGAFRAAWRLHHDALDLLDALSAAGVAVGALSNSSQQLSVAKLERLGLTDRLPLLVSPDDLGFGKPDPRVFALACARLGTEPGRTAYVGDELDVDAEAAARAGLVGVWLDRIGHREPGAPVPAPAEGVLVVRSLAAVPRVLDLGGSSGRR